MGVFLEFMIILELGEMSVLIISQQINTLSNQDFSGFGNFNNLENLYCM